MATNAGWLALFVGAAIALAGCGTEQGAADARTKTESTSESGAENGDRDASELPPPVRVRHGDTTLELDAWATCWDVSCIDGAPPVPPPDLGTLSGPVTVTFPVDGMTLEATAFSALDPEAEADDCELFPAEVTQTDEQTWEVTPRGPAGTYRFDVSGHGPDGDVTVTFQATTTESDQSAATPPSTPCQ